MYRCGSVQSRVAVARSSSLGLRALPRWLCVTGLGYRPRRSYVERKNMRLGTARSATTRPDRSSRLRRDHQAAPKLRAMFPGVEQLRFELRFEAVGSCTPVAQSHVLHPPARAYFSFPCPYADCDGRFELAAAVNAAVEEPSHPIEGVLECAGVHARDFAPSPPCDLRLHFTLIAVCSPAH